MKKITLLGSICLVVILAVMLFGACAQPAQTPVTVTAPALTVTSPPVTVTATKETIYSVLDPRSHEPPRKYQGLTPRLTTLEGKKIIVVNLRGGNEEAILSVGPALQKAIPTAKVTTYTLQEAMVSAKEWDMFKTYDAAIFGHSYWGAKANADGRITAQAELLGIPSCLEGWNDQALISIAASAAMKAGAPQIRQVLTPPDTGIKDLSAYVPDFIKALTTPLTDLEKASGTYQAPIPPRIAMTGTYDEIMAYFEGDQVSPSVLSGGPWCWMTDGLPIVPPTEEAVAAMLKGTTHKPTEELKFGARIGEDRIASIEKIAINAVMAGCKPEYMPVLLAIAEAGPATGYTGDAVQTQTYLVSGPYAQEIGMNYGFAFFTPGNKANTSIQRAAVLMGINLAGVKISVNNGERMGNPVFGDIFSESPLTPWPTLNVQKGYPSDNSILMCCLQSALVRPGIGNGVPSEDLKQLQVGTPEQLVEAFEQMPAGSILFSPDTAKIWKNEYGFQTPLQLKQYIYDNALVPLEWAKRQYYPAGQVVKFPEPDSNGMIRRLFQKKDADSAMEIVVAGGTGPAWGFGPTYTGIISIDKWR